MEGKGQNRRKGKGREGDKKKIWERCTYFLKFLDDMRLR